MDAELSESTATAPVHWGKPWLWLCNFWFAPQDVRVYDLLRISLSVAALANLAWLWPDRYRLMAADGMIPYASVFPKGFTAPYFSVFIWVESHLGVDLVMAGSALCLIGLTLGVGGGRSLLLRLLALASFVWHLSYTYRIYPSLAGWDVLLRSCHFLLLVSPLGGRYCLGKSWLGKAKCAAPSTAPRYGLLLLQWQVAVVYWGTVWLKLPDKSWRSGELMEYFFLSIYSTVGDWVVEWPTLLAALTHVSLLLETLLPLLLFSRRWRTAGIVVGVLLHGGIGLTSNLALFSVVIVSTYPAFFGLAEVERAERWIRGLWGWIRTRFDPKLVDHAT